MSEKVAPLYFFIFLVSILLFSGCSGLKVEGESGTVHHLILGIGIVSVNDTKEKAMVVTNTTALGVTLSNQPGQKLGVGYSSSSVVSVPTNAKDVRAEISKTPFGPIIVDVANAELEN